MKYFSEDFRGKAHFEAVGIKGHIMLNCTLQKSCVIYEMDRAN
jgi:hypothetical protein